MSVSVNQNDELLLGFIDESCDALADLPSKLHEFRTAGSAEAINSVFRAVHSIKGNAGFFGLLAIKKFSHALENTLDDVRHEKTTLSADLERAFIDGFDLLESMLNAVREGEAGEDLDAPQAALLERVAQAAQPKATTDTADLAATVLALADEMAACGVGEWQPWIDALRAAVPRSDTPEVAAPNSPVARPAAFAQRTCSLGAQDVSSGVAQVIELFAQVERGAYTSECGAAFTHTLDQIAAAATEIHDEEFALALAAARRDFTTIAESPLGVDPPLMSLVWDHLAPHFTRLMPDPAAAAVPPVAAPDNRPAAASKQLTETEQPHERRAEPRGEKAGAEAATDKGEDTSKGRLVRVKEEKLDQFLDDVSRLFITIERLKDLQGRMQAPSAADAAAEHVAVAGMAEELRQINSSLNKQSCELQQSVVALRKVPIRGLFQKFPRMARTLAGNLGKKINVHLAGEEVEIDKGLAEDLDAPLTHMVRNVCDHGIELPAGRLARGAPEDGNLHLKAEVTRTHVIVTVQDDGRGIDPQRLRRKAVEKGIYSEAEVRQLADEEAVALIFHPGISTAEQITEVSGRGVGLDVVRTRLREHDGDVKVESQVNVGTTFRLEIPLRQAVVVVDSLLVKHQQETFVIPFEHIREISELDRSAISTVHNQRVAQLRGTPYSAVTLHELLGLPPLPVETWNATPGVLIGCKQGSMMLLVEQILGQRKVVVNALDKVLPGLEKIAGVAQLGGGKMAMVLSAVELVKQCRRGGQTYLAS